MSFFEKNLNALARQDANLADRLRRLPSSDNVKVFAARNGEVTAQWRETLLHSRHQPGTEAKRFLDQYDLAGAKSAVVVGFALGHHVRELLRRVAVPVLVVEANLEILRAAMEEVDLTEVFARVRLRVGETATDLSQCRELSAMLSDAHIIIPHPASLQCAPEYYAELARQFERRQPLRTPGHLRVLVVSPLYGGSLPIARYAARALQQIGCTVELLDYHPFHSAFESIQSLLRDSEYKDSVIGQYTQTLSLAAYARVQAFQPDLVFALAQAPLTRDCLRKLRAERTRTAFWFVENYKCFPYWRELAPEYDYFFTIQRQPFLEELRRLGVLQASYLPTACDPEIHKLPALSGEESRRYRADISFAGYGYYNRKALFEGLTDFDLRIWGPGWQDSRSLRACVQDQGREFEEAEMRKIFAGSQINLNLHSSTYYAGVETQGDFVNPRLFELAACGAFQLVDERPPVQEFFVPGEEVACFSDLPSLRRQIRYFLDHPEERRRIAANGQRRARREHTYTARMKQMISTIFSEALLEDLERRRQEETAQGLRRQLPPDHDLLPLLNGLDPEASVTLDGLLMNRLRAGRYQNQPELVLRLMNNLLVEGRKR